MGTMLSALLHLQSIERQLTHVKGRLKTRRNAVTSQEKRIEQLRADYDALHEKAMDRRKDVDRRELDLKQKEEQVTKLRSALNLAKTNKEYAAVLTQINTNKADNAKVEEEVLKIMQDVEAIGADSEKIKAQVEAEEKRLADIKNSSDQEIQKLADMLADLTAQREQAASSVPKDPLGIFDRIAEKYEGEAMAVVEVHGRKPPFDYICGGCFMVINAEHANALRVRDEIRTCDSCGRILYMEPAAQGSNTQG
jgi:uncharacterized protein